MKLLKNWLFAEPRAARGDIFAALDIGSSKIACLIARSENEGPPRIVGIGHQLSEGMKQGGVSNMEAAVESSLTDKRSKVMADSRTSQLIVVTTEKEQDTVATLVEQLDKPTRQVLI